MAKYEYQMNLILQNIFEKKEKASKSNPSHWIRKMTNLVGGTLYQHAHADQAWPWELEGERPFPFVASHGFGRMKWNFGYYLRAHGARVNTDSYTNYHGRQCSSCVGILSMPGELCDIRAVT